VAANREFIELNASAPLRPAALAFDESGTPISSEYGDVYHSAASGPGQARHVFLQGNDLPGRWAQANIFSIVETGFGLGLNFLATWQAWRQGPQRGARLHFVSIERHPFSAEHLAVLHARHAEFTPLSASLRAAWPALVPGLHRLHFDDGQVTLTLAFADIATALPELCVSADAFYLDGFAPERNPDMWSAQNMKSLARLAKPGATLATWTIARPVRDALAAAGFVVDRRAGYGGKRDMLVARFAPRWPMFARHVVPATYPDKRAIVVGAGLAGAAVASRLGARGWSIDLVERAHTPAAAASGLRAGIFQPHVSRDDCLLSRLTRAGYLYAQARWQADLGPNATPPWQRCGVLQLADGAANEARVAETARLFSYPQDYAQYLTSDAASALAGRAVAVGGWWFAHAGWVRPATVVQLQLTATAPCVTLHPDCEITALERVGARWQARDASGAAIAQASVVVLANAGDAARLVDLGVDSLRSVRGQQSYLPAPPFAAPRIVVGGDGYVLPEHDGIAVCGATYDLDNSNTRPDSASHALNVERVERMLPGSTAQVDRARLDGGVGIRCVATDRMPMFGAMVDVVASRAQAPSLIGAHLADLPRLTGMFGAFAFASRGLTWTLLAAELLASQIDGEPLPVERALVDAIDPGRFILRRLRRGKL
jgi:tRNA 5-methylaminomethyl-2-thiouridine biosynthesis bifunctional protein